MEFTKQQKIRIVFAVGIILPIILLNFCVMNSPEYLRKQQSKKDAADAASLRSVIAEAYLNINADSDFVNTATEDEPMEIPEKYYTYVESVQGDGPVHVVVDPNYNVEAYFGTPEKTRGYYEDLCGDET